MMSTFEYFVHLQLKGDQEQTAYSLEVLPDWSTVQRWRKHQSSDKSDLQQVTCQSLPACCSDDQFVT